MTESRGRRKVKQGTVLSTKMDKTAVVQVERKYRHPKYGKVVRGVKKYYAHDDQANTLNAGDTVTIVESRPISKLKRWRVVREG